MKLDKQILVLPKEKYLFFLSSKCASSSVRRMAIFDLKYGEPLIYITNLKALQMYMDFKWIMIVRSPWDRIRSLWKDKVFRHVHKEFRSLGFTRGESFSEFGKRFHGISDLLKCGSHLWPMFTLFPYFEKGRNTLLLDLKDLRKWPIELPFLRKENQSKIIVPEEKGKLGSRQSKILREKYIMDFDYYDSFNS